MTRKILLPIDSRANLTRALTIAEAIHHHPNLQLQLVTIGPFSNEWQNWLPDHLRPSGVVVTPLLDDTPSSMVAAFSDIMESLRTTINRLEPDLSICLTDRYESLAVATTCSLMNIPLAHIQGGEVTGTIDESIRHAITKLSHIHFPATGEAAKRIISMGEDSNYVFNVGCPATDLLLGVDTSTRIIPEPYLLALLHPVTTEYGQSYDMACEVFKGIRAVWDGKVVVIGPNHDAGCWGIWEAIKASGYTAPNSATHEQFVNLMANAEVFITNSSAGIRESCYFGTPTVDVGSRQQGRYPRGRNVSHVSLGTRHDWEHIAEIVQFKLAWGRYAPEYLYGDGKAGELIARILGDMEHLPGVQKHYCDH